MKAKHIKRGFKKFGGWVKHKSPYLLCDMSKTVFVNGKATYVFPYKGE